MKCKPAMAGALALAALALPASPALAAKGHARNRPSPVQRALANSRRSLSISRRALGKSSRALRVSRYTSNQAGRIGRRELALGGVVAAIQRSLTTLYGSLATLQSSVNSLSSAVSSLNGEVNDANSGLGKVDDGVVGVYLAQSGGSPVFQAPLFASDIPQAVGVGASTSGTAVLVCNTAPCTLSFYASDDSNRPQPPSGSAAAYVGGAATVSSVSSTTAAESFYFGGETPANSSMNNDLLVPIPTRQTLGQLVYPSPSDSRAVQVPIDGTNANGTRQTSGTIELSSPGVYIASATFNFIGELV
jgi:hypothetical protein